MTFVLAIVKSILATQRNDFGFNKCELKSLNNVGYCGKKFVKNETFSNDFFCHFATIFWNVCRKFRLNVMKDQRTKARITQKRHQEIIIVYDATSSIMLHLTQCVTSFLQRFAHLPKCQLVKRSLSSKMWQNNTLRDKPIQNIVNYQKSQKKCFTL